MADIFPTIGIIGKFSDPSVGATIQMLGRYLTERRHRVLLETETAAIIAITEFETATREDIGVACDLVIMVGGDGTMLNAARSLAKYQVPLVGINLGRLGFLTDISPDNCLHKLEAILQGKFKEERRSMLQGTFECEGGLTTEGVALNEVVVHKLNVARMIELDTYIDGQYVNTVCSDGLIVSTPTGSTAYALSGGGPLVHPALTAILLVPICPHTMSHRPIVVDGNSEVQVVVTKHNREDAQVTCDGQVNFNLLPGDRAIIRKLETDLRLIHPESYDYYAILRAKLHWGRKPEA